MNQKLANPVNQAGAVYPEETANLEEWARQDLLGSKVVADSPENQAKKVNPEAKVTRANEE